MNTRDTPLTSATTRLKEYSTVSTTTMSTANTTRQALAPEDAALVQELERVKRLLVAAAQADDLVLASGLLKSWKSLAWRTRHLRGGGN